MGIQKFLVLFIAISLQTQAQSDSTIHLQSVKPPINWKHVLPVPSVLVGLGILATIDNDVLYREDFYELRNKWMPHFRTPVDDYLQYAPIAGAIILNAAGIRGEHDIANQTALLIKSELIMAAIVLPLKKLTAIPRPDTHFPNSFPSGHTAQAFVAATFLHKEYGRENPLYSVLAYSTATGIGLLRVMNNRHWISDVLVGAGIGIFATNLAYLTHKNKWGHKRKRFAGAILVPTYAQRSFGMSMVIPVH